MNVGAHATLVLIPRVWSNDDDLTDCTVSTWPLDKVCLLLSKSLNVNKPSTVKHKLFTSVLEYAVQRVVTACYN